MTYKPPQRVIPARVRTNAGWMTASFHVPRSHSFAEHLASLPLFNVTNALLPRAKEALPFVALRRESIGLVVPRDHGAALLAQPLHGETRKHLVTCLLPWGTIRGELEILANVRVSDYLLHHDGFICLRNAVPGGGGESKPLVLVNAAALVGVSEVPGQ